MKKHRLLGLAVAFLVIATLACGGGNETPPPPTLAPSTEAPPTEPPPPPTEPPPTEEPTEETASLVIENESEGTICYVLISPEDDDDWGNDWLGDSDVIGPGDSHTFEVPVGLYDVEARDCDNEVLATEWAQDLDGTVTWTISEVAQPSSDGATELSISGDPNFGSLDMESGFSPDLQEMSLISGGEVDVVSLNLGTDCGGYATGAPDLRMNLIDGFDLLRVFFVSDEGEDATMIINDPSGNWLCNDDFSDWNPMVELANAKSGQYDIWVGSYSADEYIVGTLYVTEMDYDPSNLPEGGASSDGGDGLDISLEPGFGTADLESGFQPDPHEVALISGGSVDVAAELGSDCGGYAASAPDYRINLTSGSDLLRIFFVAGEEEDSTLIVNGPSGDWYCNDDFAGYDPMIELESAVSGQYDIWVGSYSDGEFIVGTLYITEMDYDPGNLP
ncbi:MAG: hypothetical protein GY832_35610 [Chloroflexi bacterium]|nr:hypothetical protein [Chloroflexota bacterium]